MKRFTAFEPALFVGLVQAGIALAIAAGFHLTVTQAGSIEAAAAALGGLVVALAVRPFQVPVLTGALGTVGTLLMTFGVPHVSAGLVSAVNAFLVSVLAIVLRGHVSPTVSDGPAPVTATPGPAPAAPQSM